MTEDNFAIVEFRLHENTKKKFVEVVRYEWLTEECTEVFCPKNKDWKIALKSSGGPKSFWKKYSCRVLKSNIDNLKAAHMECQTRLNYTSDSCDSSAESERYVTTNATEVYSNIFDQCTNVDDSLCKIQSAIEKTNNHEPPKIMDQIIISPSNIIHDTSENNDNEKIKNTGTLNENQHNIQEDLAFYIDTSNELTQLQNISQSVTIIPDNFEQFQLPGSQSASDSNSRSVMFPQEKFQTILHELAVLREDIFKISSQNEVIMKMITEMYKKKPSPSSFQIIYGIKTEKDLKDFEEKLKEEEFRKNMAYEYTQFAWKGDSKKEVNGFVKSMIIKIFCHEFLRRIRWDRISKKSVKIASTSPEENEIIFLKKYKNILHLMTDV